MLCSDHLTVLVSFFYVVLVFVSAITDYFPRRSFKCPPTTAQRSCLWVSRGVSDDLNLQRSTARLVSFVLGIGRRVRVNGEGGFCDMGLFWTVRFFPATRVTRHRDMFRFAVWFLFCCGIAREKCGRQAAKHQQTTEVTDGTFRLFGVGAPG